MKAHGASFMQVMVCSILKSYCISRRQWIAGGQQTGTRDVCIRSQPSDMQGDRWPSVHRQQMGFALRA